MPQLVVVFLIQSQQFSSKLLMERWLLVASGTRSHGMQMFMTFWSCEKTMARRSNVPGALLWCLPTRDVMLVWVWGMKKRHDGGIVLADIWRCPSFSEYWFVFFPRNRTYKCYPWYRHQKWRRQLSWCGVGFVVSVVLEVPRKTYTNGVAPVLPILCRPGTCFLACGSLISSWSVPRYWFSTDALGWGQGTWRWLWSCWQMVTGNMCNIVSIVMISIDITIYYDSWLDIILLDVTMKYEAVVVVAVT